MPFLSILLRLNSAIYVMRNIGDILSRYLSISRFVEIVKRKLRNARCIHCYLEPSERSGKSEEMRDPSRSEATVAEASDTLVARLGYSIDTTLANVSVTRKKLVG